MFDLVANKSWVEICRERVADKIEADSPAAIICRERVVNLSWTSRKLVVNES
jgi:hypothetical protein